MKKIAMFAALLLFPALAAAQTVPDGWTKESVGDEVRLSPARLGPGQVFSVAGLPDDAADGELDEWLAGRVRRDVRKLGAVVNEKPVVQVQKQVLKKVLSVRTARGQAVSVIYFGGLGRTGRFELYRVVSTPDRALAGRHMKDALAIIESWPSRPAEERRDSRREERPRDDRPREDRTAAYRTAPGRGIKPSEIAFFTAELTLKVQPDMSVMPAHDVVMVLKNGEACDYVNVPPSDMNAAAHKQAHPGRWARWRKRGQTYERLGGKGQWKKVDWKLRLHPARPGDQLRGTLTSTNASVIPGGGTATTAVASSKSFIFLPGRRFRDERFSSVSHQSDSGGRGRGVSMSGSSEDKKEGTYVLDGTTLELRYSDGTVDRRAFLWASEKREGTIVLNSSVYLLAD